MPAHPADGTGVYDPSFDALLADAFGPESTTARGWSRPPMLRDDPSDHAPLVRPDSPDMPKADPGRYQLLGEIARGGMGVVLKGRDPDLGRDIAVKVLKSEFAGRASAEQRFVEEAQVGGQLQHPGVVPVYELGRFADGRPYFTMKLVKGRTLAALLTERPSPDADRGRYLRIFEDVCQAIAYAHSRGVIHRDLKPANVMVGSFGEVQVMDWGLSKVLAQGGVADEDKASRRRQPPSSREESTIIRTARAGSGSETQAGSVLGTPAFMPPEQAVGEVDKLDERADVFGLGAILCVILTGQPPYTSDNGEAVRLMAVRGQVGDAFARLEGCGTDAELVGLCKRCLAPERDDRPRHAGEVSAAVTTYLVGVEDRAHRAEVERAAAEVRAAEQRKRRRVQAAFGMVLTAAVGMAGFGLWWQERQTAAAKAERAGRQAGTKAAMDQALIDARQRIAEGWDQIFFPDRMRVAADAARAAVRRAEGFAATGEPSDADRAGLETVRTDLTELDRHLRLIEDYEACKRLLAEQVADGQPGGPNGAAVRRRMTALRRFGIDPLAASPDEVAEFVAGSRLRDTLITILARMPNYHSDPTEKDRFVQAVRATRARCGGAYARWQELLDQKDAKGLAAFAMTPEVMQFGPDPIRILGWDLRAVGEIAATRALLRASVDRYPHDFYAHGDLALACVDSIPRDWFQALRHWGAALALQPRSPYFQTYVGYAYASLGNRTQAIAAFRKSMQLATVASSFNTLGNTCYLCWDLEGAIAAYRKSVELEPGTAVYHAKLCRALLASHDWIAAAETGRRAVELEPALADKDEWVRVAHVGLSRPGELDALLSRMIAATPNLAADPNTQLRSFAALAAVHFAAAQSGDRPSPGERPRLRGKAWGYLNADLAAWRNRFTRQPGISREIVHLHLTHWLSDPALASVRHPIALAYLPKEERTAWTKLWADVRTLRDATVPREEAPPRAAR